MRHALFAVLLACCTTLLAAIDGADAAWPMRWRTACDPAAGWACRYPYTWQMRDQYAAEFFRGFNEESAVPGNQTVVRNGQKVLLVRRNGPVLRLFSAVEIGSPDEVGSREGLVKLAWSDYDYYARPADRPHGDPAWAPEGIQARLGVSTKPAVTVLAVRHGDRVSGLVLQLAADDPVAMRLIDSFEILSTGLKTRPGSKPIKDARPMTWRERSWRGKQQVIDADQHPIPASRTLPAQPWARAWEIETEHYHITGNLSPGRLAWHGLYAEALYRAYSALYQPETMPPIKFEVHIFATARQFHEASAAWGHGIDAGPGGIVGGFFVPDLLSLWVYEESGQLGGADFSVEHVMAHECSHQFLHIACNGSAHVPTWINEGLAVYFENGQFLNGSFQLRPPSERIAQLKQRYQAAKTTLWPLDRYIGHGGAISAAQYGEVYAMTHFWVFGVNGGLERFKTYWARLKKGDDGQKAFEEVFMTDMIKAQGGRDAAIAAWQQALLAYVKTLK